MINGRSLVIGLWIAWALYWLASAFFSKATVRREPFGSRLAYVVPLLVGILLIWRQQPWEWLNARLWPHSPIACWVGVALLAAGLGFAVWARVYLGRNWSGSVTVKEDHELVRTGPYALVRHPIYTGLIAALLGTAITFGTLRAALGLTIMVASFLYKLRLEEAFMRETFPGVYQRYSAEVPALIPFARARRSAPR